MARVPVRRQVRSFTDPAAGRTPVDPRQIESVYGGLAQAIGGAIDTADTALAETRGAEAGQRAVTRDEEGNIQVDELSFIERMASPRYAQKRAVAAQAAALAEYERDITKKLGELRELNRTDVQGFDSAGMAFARQLRDKAGRLGPAVFDLAQREVGRVSRGIQVAAERAKLQKEEGALRTSIADKENALMALARQGGVNTEEFQQIAAELRGQWQILVDTEVFGVSQEEAEFSLQNVGSRAKLEASSRDVLGVYGAKGELAAIEHARKVADSLPGLTEPQREEWVADQRQLINEREAARNKAEARMRRINARRIDDAVATLAAGNDATSLLNDPNLFVGFKPDEVQLAQEELAAAKRAGQARKALQGADPATRAQILNSFVIEGPGAALTARYRASLETEAGQIARRLDKDPVGQVAQSDPELVDDLGTAMQNGDADAFADAAASLIEEQGRLGAFNPRLLSAAQRKALAANIIGDENDPERVTKMVGEIERLSSVAGVHFPRIMAEIAQEEDFPAAAFGIGLLDGKEHAQFLLAKAAAEDPKVLRENVGKLGTGAAGELRDDLAAAARPLVESLAASGASQTYIAKVSESVEALASQFAVEQGKVDGAAKKAFKTLFGDYHFEGSYRVPPAHDPDLVQLGTREFKEAFQADDFIVPRPDPRQTPEAAGRSYVAHLKTFGRWVTNRDETGLILVDGEGEIVMERPLNSGEAPQPFEITFEQLEEFGRRPGARVREKMEQARLKAQGLR